MCTPPGPVAAANVGAPYCHRLPRPATWAAADDASQTGLGRCHGIAQVRILRIYRGLWWSVRSCDRTKQLKSRRCEAG